MNKTLKNIILKELNNTISISSIYPIRGVLSTAYGCVLSKMYKI